MKTKRETLQLKFMEYIFFLQGMPTVKVSMESNGFRASTPETHSHFKYNYPTGYDETNALEEEVRLLKDFILDVHEYNEQHVDFMTHEELKKRNMNQFDFISSAGKPAKLIQSQEQRDSYLTKIAELKAIPNT